MVRLLYGWCSLEGVGPALVLLRFRSVSFFLAQSSLSDVLMQRLNNIAVSLEVPNG